MNFLNSIILAGLAAALAPLLIHLLNRQRVRTVEFSSLMFLRDLQKTKMRRLKLRQWLLLLIRTLIVVLLVLAFARPSMRGDTFASLGSHAKTTVALLTDISASMHTRTADGSAFERSIHRQPEVLEVLKEGDQVIRGEIADDTYFSSPTADFAGVAEEVVELSPGNSGTDLMTAIAESEELLTQSQNLNREIFVFSDMSRVGFTTTGGLPEPTAERPPRIYFIDVSDDRAVNAAVVGLEFSGDLIQAQVPFTVRAQIENRCNESFDHMLVGAFIDGRRVAQSDVTLPRNESASVEFRLTIDAPGLHAGYIEIADDDNLVDNRYYFAIHIPRTLEVLLASDYPTGREFLRRAINPTGEGRVNVVERDVDGLVRENLAQYDAILLANFRELDPVLWEQLDRFLRAGGGVALFSGPDVDTAAFNQHILRPYFTSSFTAVPERYPSNETYYELEKGGWNHPILSVYQEIPDEQIPDVQFYSTFELGNLAGVRAVLRCADGRPALIEAAVRQGKLLVWTAPLDPTHSDIAFHSIFVPLMGRTVEYLATQLGEQAESTTVGRPVTRPRQLSWREPLILRYPDGREEQLAASPTGSVETYTTPPLAMPGCYTLFDGDQPVDIFAVNIDPDETDVQPITQQEIVQRLPGRALTFLDAGDNITEAVMAARYGQELWKIFLWAAVALIALEMLLARTRKSEMPPDLAS